MPKTRSAVAEEREQPKQEGCVHLHVGDLERGLAFYRDVLGFELVTFFPGQAAFVSAGGYHHHLGFSVWRGGRTSSSDGQVFFAGGSKDALCQPNAKYGRERGVAFYTYVSDQYAPFHSRVKHHR